jgi:hypothetical protein
MTARLCRIEDGTGTLLTQCFEAWLLFAPEVRHREDLLNLDVRMQPVPEQLCQRCTTVRLTHPVPAPLTLLSL